MTDDGYDLYYDRNGDPIDRDTFARLHNDLAYKVVERDEVGGYLVSTVWLGIDHSFGAGPPILFETMIFLGEVGGSDLDTRRYATEEEARAGHAELLNEVQLLAQLVELTEE